MLSAHDADGFLPKGVHQASWDEFVARFGNTTRRQELLAAVRPALRHFANHGAAGAFVGGSFVSTKPAPGDLDVVIETAGLNVAACHPFLIDLGMRDWQKATFGAEFFPDTIIEESTGLTFVEFFAIPRGRTEPVGIVWLDLSTV